MRTRQHMVQTPTRLPIVTVQDMMRIRQAAMEIVTFTDMTMGTTSRGICPGIFLKPGILFSLSA
jgi:hypothetical protein